MTDWTFHGGKLDAARHIFGDADAPWMDLSTGINPDSWPVEKAPAFDWRALPGDAQLAALEHSAAAHFGVDPAHLCALPGSEAGLRLLGELLPGELLHGAACYRTHRDIRPDSRAFVPGQDDPAGKILLLANPNNPDGRLLGRPMLDALLQRQTDSGGWLVLDEAYADCQPDGSMAHRVDDAQRLILFRSLGKFFGLAGLRLGFVIGPRSIVVRFRERLGSWPLSTAALVIGAAAYADRGWIDAMRGHLVQQALALDAVLRVHGLNPQGACPLFRLIETEDAMALFERLARGAILTRPFDENAHWLRIGLPQGADGLARLDRTLAHG
ncbi:aminotransferase class I/II-fold pyridoxal phosphate-dependent enzyme [Sphingobium sp. WCS2017Hpa-17]|uniref:aminotransferase class I/II-fold pyridoxal phosphate-dependent enzyme n=1 Tax=Sphingobium sp. WCS2017Hpa-17 TaxID=3073638 RepID=UPI0028892DE8|nr:aminotransferase class I/II-fold pyridoxal phosphate-dependent enzyme [Sphingobium sp. WCS2017Hpa-17]